MMRDILQHLHDGGTIITLDSYTDICPAYRVVDGILHRADILRRCVPQIEPQTDFRPDGCWASPMQFVAAAAHYFRPDQFLFV